VRSGHADPAPAAPAASAAPVATATPDIADAGSDATVPTHPPVTPPSYALIEASGDKPLRVLPAAKPGARALVYLHGYCGDVNAVGAFVPAAAAHGRLIALLGDQPCLDKPGRFKWSNDIRGLDARIQRAVRLVNRAQGLHLDPHDITLFGYSQGAVRAESLARFYASHYPRLILGGPPRRPKPEHFSRIRVIAVFGGELEDTRDMLGGADDLAAAGFHARFFLLPGVDHGDFGGELAGNQALGEILSFVDGEPPPSPDTPSKVAR
jgi:pimeloyl-ACP methyl ester carboxylesterase